MSTCDRFQAHFNDFLDGTLGARQAQELNAHLLDCTACRREYRALRTTQELVRTVAVPGDGEAKRRVMKRFRQAVGSEATPLPVAAPRPSVLTRPSVSARSTASERSRWSAPLLPLGAAVAMAALMVAVMLPQLRRDRNPLPGSGNPVIIATAACNATLPTADDLDQMTSAHAVQSFTVQNGSAEAQQETLADANSRLSPEHNRQ